VSAEHLTDFGCECGAEGCEARIEMTMSERDAVDHAGNRWAIAPEHQIMAGDRVIERHARFWVIESNSQDP
jgi:hypothetical protein